MLNCRGLCLPTTKLYENFNGANLRAKVAVYGLRPRYVFEHGQRFLYAKDTLRPSTSFHPSIEPL